jgi:hypothetical protein
MARLGQEWSTTRYTYAIITLTRRSGCSGDSVCIGSGGVCCGICDDGDSWQQHDCNRERNKQ